MHEYVVLEGFCDNGGFLDECIRKLEDFDRDAYNYINGKDFITRAEALKTKINNTAGALSSMTVYQPNIKKQSVSLISLSTTSAVNPFKFFQNLLGSNVVEKKAFSEDDYIQSLKDQYGFTDEQAAIIQKAYRAYETVEEKKIIKKNNDDKMHEFFGNLAALNEGYGNNTDFSIDKNLSAKENISKLKGNFKPFNILASTPSTESAIKFFDKLGINGMELKDAINEQHVNCEGNEKRDFVHECAIIAVMSDKKNVRKAGGDVVDDIDSAIGYKGDVYSGSMGIDDMKSDVDARNIYYRMKKCDDGDIWYTMTEYNTGIEDGSINGAKEFLEYFGDGDAKKGLEELKKDLDKETITTDILSKDVMPAEIESRKKAFIDYVSGK